ncbi:hypothetical protein RD110_12330 [Rhodoferax koreense]|uniref:Uncharacterized protein n=2 Tax=Rhodoferax koreensis TaxID=1842727 RepID=A0A1P8JVU0_9BURK|nr:hypothetical protein RD110_12330 [Rhodoferax koreense]
MSDPTLCATFQLAQETGKWIQYGDDRINAAYPSHLDPSALVATLGGQLECWEAHKYVTVVIAGTEATAVARWIDAYFRWVLSRRDAAMTFRVSRFQRCIDPV